MEVCVSALNGEDTLFHATSVANLRVSVAAEYATFTSCIHLLHDGTLIADNQRLVPAYHVVRDPEMHGSGRDWIAVLEKHVAEGDTEAIRRAKKYFTLEVKSQISALLYEIDQFYRPNVSVTMVERVAWENNAARWKLCVECVDGLNLDNFLEFAAKIGDLTMVQFLQKDNSNPRPLLNAAREGHVHIVKALASSEVVNGPGCFHAPLHLAASKGHVAVVSQLLASSALVNTLGGNSWERATPLYLASASGKDEVVSVLLQAGALVDCGRRIPLHAAAKNGHIAVVQHLIRAGARVNEEGWTDRTALFFASSNGYLAVVSALLDAGASTYHSTNVGLTVLHAAAENGHTPVVSALIEAAAPVDQENVDGYRALHFAAQRAHIEVISCLIQAGASVNDKARDGCTPIDVADPLALATLRSQSALKKRAWILSCDFFE